MQRAQRIGVPRARLENDHRPGRPELRRYPYAIHRGLI